MQTRHGCLASRQSLNATCTREYEDRLDWLENQREPLPLSPRQVGILLQWAAWVSS